MSTDELMRVDPITGRDDLTKKEAYDLVSGLVNLLNIDPPDDLPPDCENRWLIGEIFLQVQRLQNALTEEYVAGRRHQQEKEDAYQKGFKEGGKQPSVPNARCSEHVQKLRSFVYQLEGLVDAPEEKQSWWVRKVGDSIEGLSNLWGGEPEKAEEDRGIPIKTVDMLKVDYSHSSLESLVLGLEMFFDIYANRGNWKSSTGEPPHRLREGVHLDFYPGNVVHGWSFAEEALQKIKKFREENK